MTARLKEQGKKIYLITARHDYYEDGSPVEFDDDELIPVKGTPMYEAMAKLPQKASSCYPYNRKENECEKSCAV